MVGIGVITCNRPDFLKKCVGSIRPEWVDKCIIVNDGEKLEDNISDYPVINNDTNLGVCKTKNIALKHLLDAGCDYIFLVEDDMFFKGNVFEKYIEASRITGIEHFSFAYHGDYNKKNSKPNPRKIVKYNGCEISLNKHSVGAVCFYTRKSLKDVGLFDEKFSEYGNAFDHVEHSYRLAKSKYSTPYWWWSDLANSFDYIEEQGDADTNTTVRNKEDWVDNVKNAAKYFNNKHDHMPAWNNCVPDTKLEDMLKFLKTIRK